MKELSQEQIASLEDYKMTLPIPLKDADLGEPFIYDRRYGVFYIQGSYHLSGTAMLYAWSQGAKNSFDFLMDTGLNAGKQSEKFLLDLEGTAVGSSVSSFIEIGRLKNLNEEEKQIFSNFQLKILSDILGI